MGSEFVPDKPTRYLQYLDANNLYGWAMSQPLPTGEFKWVDIRPTGPGAAKRPVKPRELENSQNASQRDIS